MPHKFRLFIGLILLLAGCSATAAGDPLAAQREQFIEARKALKQKQVSRYRELAAGLKTYPLYPYLEFDALRQRLGEAEANALSVRQELQADCFAGIWGHHASRSRQLLESGDIEEGLRAASAIGDDRLQKQSRGYVSPESFTHGSSAQRVRWFKQGLKSGEVLDCNTFRADTL